MGACGSDVPSTPAPDKHTLPVESGVVSNEPGPLPLEPPPSPGEMQDAGQGGGGREESEEKEAEGRTRSLFQQGRLGKRSPGPGEDTQSPA